MSGFWQEQGNCKPSFGLGIRWRMKTEHHSPHWRAFECSEVIWKIEHGKILNEECGRRTPREAFLRPDKSSALHFNERLQSNRHSMLQWESVFETCERMACVRNSNLRARVHVLRTSSRLKWTTFPKQNAQFSRNHLPRRHCISLEY